MYSSHTFPRPVSPNLNLNLNLILNLNLNLNFSLPTGSCINNNNLVKQGLREAHVRDGVALTAFLSWLERAMDAGEAGGGGGIGWPLTEFTVAEKLDRFR